MEIIILGCGSSLGAPVIGCKCEVCISTLKYNKRTRSAIIIQSLKTRILVDFGPEIRSQLLVNSIDNIDGVICTHGHSDHIAGIDDLRVFSSLDKQSLMLYSDGATLKELQNFHKYLFDPKRSDYPTLTPSYPLISLNEVDTYASFTIGDLPIQLFQQIHGATTSIGIRVNDFVYSNDLTEFPFISEKYLYDIKCWVIDCIDYQHTHAHCGLDDVLKFDEKFSPKQIYLTNLSHNLEYQTLTAELPSHIRLCYDSLRIQV